METEDGDGKRRAFESYTRIANTSQHQTCTPHPQLPGTNLVADANPLLTVGSAYEGRVKSV